MDCLFCKIASGEIDTQIIYQDNHVIAFDDINPQAPIHKIIIPKLHIATLNDAEPEDAELLGHLFLGARNIAKELGLHDSGYRTIVNCNDDGGQTVFHIHLHLLGGRRMTWPPG